MNQFSFMNSYLTVGRILQKHKNTTVVMFLAALRVKINIFWNESC